MSVHFHFSMRTIHHLQRIQTLLEQLHPEAPPQALLAPASPTPRGAIIVFPGSFNPPTTAHLALLKQAQQFARLHAVSTSKRGRSSRKERTMQLYVAMSKHTVDKENVERPLMLDRIMLLDTLLRRRFPYAGILLFNRGLYVEQAQAVRTAFPHVTRLLFLIGFDKIVQILDPHYYDDRDAALRGLFSLAELLVAPRGGDGTVGAGVERGREGELASALGELVRRPENQPFAQHIHALPFSSAYRYFSSTHIRQSASAHAYEIPHEVRDFMRKTRAYAPPLRRQDGSEIDYYGERVKTLRTLLRNVQDER